MFLTLKLFLSNFKIVIPFIVDFNRIQMTHVRETEKGTMMPKTVGRTVLKRRKNHMNIIVILDVNVKVFSGNTKLVQTKNDRPMGQLNHLNVIQPNQRRSRTYAY